MAMAFIILLACCSLGGCLHLADSTLLLRELCLDFLPGSILPCHRPKKLYFFINQWEQHIFTVYWKTSHSILEVGTSSKNVEALFPFLIPQPMHLFLHILRGILHKKPTNVSFGLWSLWEAAGTNHIQWGVVGPQCVWGFSEAQVRQSGPWKWQLI